MTLEEWNAVRVFAMIGRSYAEGQLALGDVDAEVADHLNRMLDDAHKVMTETNAKLVNEILAREPVAAQIPLRNVA